MKAKRPKPKPDQHKAFVETARELGCNESEKAFDKALEKLAKGQAKPKP
jgi:hypothetical protein